MTKKRATANSKSVITTLFIQAHDKDVLMGRGKRVSEWPGNVYFRQIVHDHRVAYTAAHRNAKVRIAKSVIEKIKVTGGRFLKEESDGNWSEIEYNRAVEKTCQALREKDRPAGWPESPDMKTRRKRSSSDVGSSSNDDDDDDDDLNHALSKRTRSRTAMATKVKAPTIKAKRKSKAMGGDKSCRDESDDNESTIDDRGGTADIDSTRDVGKGTRRKKRKPSASSQEKPIPCFEEKNNVDAGNDNDDKRKAGVETNPIPNPMLAQDCRHHHPEDDVSRGEVSSSKTDQETIQAAKVDRDKVDPHHDQPSKSPTAVSAVTNEATAPIVASDDDMFGRLAVFYQNFRHYGVPPGWPDDILLADWCTAQRQLYREIHQQQFRPATAIEEARLEKLMALKSSGITVDSDPANHSDRGSGFVWDFESWHWEHQYGKLAKTLIAQQDDTKEGAKDDTFSELPSSTTMTPSADLLQWIQDQRQQYREASWQISADRLEKLQKIGIQL